MSADDLIMYKLAKTWLRYLDRSTLCGTENPRTKSAYNDWLLEFGDAMQVFECHEACELMQRIDAFIESETFKKLWNEEHQ